MAQQLLQLFQAHAAHDRPGRERVPERVEVDVIEFRVGDSALVSLPNALSAEDAPGLLGVEADQSVVGLSVQRHLTAQTALRHLEADDRQQASDGFSRLYAGSKESVRAGVSEG